jgi:hypothetical protein
LLENMRLLTDVPRHPFGSMWLGLLIGFPFATLIMEVVAPGAAGSLDHRVDWFGFMLFMAFVVGAAVTLIVATPVMYLLLRLRFLGPLTAVLFGIVVTVVSGFVAGQPGAFITVGIYTTCTVAVYLCSAHSQLFSNSSVERTRRE